MNIRNTIRPIVRGVYDLQKLRIQMGNRIVANFKSKLGQQPSTKEEESLTEDAEQLLRQLKAAYKLLGTAVAEFKTRKTPTTDQPFIGNELISNETELCLIEQYIDLEAQENRTFRRLNKVLESIPIYRDYLSNVTGIGPAMAGVIVSEIDIHKAKYASSIWMYAGLDVVQIKDEGSEETHGEGRSRKAAHLIDREYTDADGAKQMRKSITFNPWLKTKLVGVLAGSFLKCNNEQYRAIYDNYRNRLENHAKYKDDTKLHRHRMALRYMVKIFLIDLYKAWRSLEGLPVHDPYHEAKLGLKHEKAA